MVDRSFYRKDAFISRNLRRKARAISYLIGGDPDDYEHRLWLRIVQSEERFDAERSGFETFAERITKNEVRSIIRFHYAQKRDPRCELFSMNGVYEDEEGEATSVHETMPSPFDLEPARIDLVEDFRTLLSQLSTREQAIVQGRVDGVQVAQIREALGLSRREYEESWDRICEAAERLELHEYLR